MDRASIYVQPSLLEALGLALQEAMFRGCPCVGSTAGGIPELIESGKTGLLTTKGNARELAIAMESLIQDDGLREKYGRAAVQSIVDRGMTRESMIANHVKMYESIMKRPCQY
jgi:glycosyltransferase involved in cell wall biosynthesis